MSSSGSAASRLLSGECSPGILLLAPACALSGFAVGSGEDSGEETKLYGVVGLLCEVEDRLLGLLRLRGVWNVVPWPDSNNWDWCAKTSLSQEEVGVLSSSDIGTGALRTGARCLSGEVFKEPSKREE